MRRRVRLLARDLPLFESVWIDALAQARVITPFQAAELNAGRGQRLVVGPYVLCRRLPSPGYASSFVARHTKTGRRVRLVLVDVDRREHPRVATQLNELAIRSLQSGLAELAMLEECGVDQGRLWACCREVTGVSAADWLIQHGRFAAGSVQEIARSMVASLAALEQAGIPHGDISARGLVLGRGGQVALPLPGLRQVARPEEGYAFADLPPDAYDYLAPERIADGLGITTTTDVYACGCLWWQLLAGRPPFSGGNSLAKLRLIQTARVVDVRRLAPDVDAHLADVIEQCMQRDPNARPASFQQLVDSLGAPTRHGRAELVDNLIRRPREPVGLGSPRSPAMGNGRLRSTATIATVAAVVLALVGWPLSKHFRQQPDAEVAISTAADAIKNSSSAPKLDGTKDAPAVRSDTSDEVIPAGYETSRPVKILATDRPLELDRLQVAVGTTVRGEGQQRPLVRVPIGGLLLDTPGVRCEGIDFVWEPPSDRAMVGDVPMAIVTVDAQDVSFQGCTFRAAKGPAGRPTAIRWRTGGAETARRSLVSGRLRLADCLTWGVTTGIDVHFHGAVRVEIVNTLHLGSGPLVQLDRLPEADEPVVIDLRQSTARGGGLLACRYAAIPGQIGTITVLANDSVFDPATDGSLIELLGRDNPQAILRSLEWTGQGALVTPAVSLLSWTRDEGRSELLDDGLANIDGLVRSAVQFAGPADARPSSSTATRWQVPLRSSRPPGIDPARLVGPR